MKLNFFLLLFFLSLACTPRPEIHGRVINIADGDSFTVLLSTNQKMKVRMYGVDAPEKGQDFSQVSRQFLIDLLKNKSVRITKMDTDQYGRTIGVVKLGIIIVNEEMLKAGLAWHYKGYDDNPAWSDLELQARTAKRGLWSDPHPLPPWKFRKEKRLVRKNKADKVTEP